MKEKIIDKIIKETIYVASDGTEFRDKEQCKKYEDTAKCALLAKYNPGVINNLSEYHLFDTGSEEYMYDLFKLQYNWQIDTIIQLHCLSYPRYNQGDIDVLRQKLEKNMGNILLIGRGAEYDGFNFYIYGSIEDRIAFILKNCKLDEKNS